MSTKQSLQEKIVKGSIVTLILSFLGSVFAYLIRIVYSHNLSIENYGLFYAVLSLPLAFATYLDLGFGYSAVYLLPKYLKVKNFAKAWNVFIYGQVVSLIMSILVSLLLIVTAPFLAAYYFKVAGAENLIYIFCVFLIAFSLINGMIVIYSGMQKEKYYASIALLRWLLTFVISIFFILLGFSNIIFFAIAWSVGHLMTSLIYLFLLFYRHSYLTINKISWEKETFKQMFSLAIPAMMDTFISSVFLLTITFFLTLFKGVAEVGMYNIIFPLASIPIVLLNPLNTLLLPLVSHLCEGEKKKLEYLTEKILQIIPFVGSYFALFIILFPSASVALIFGQKWLGKVELSLSILALGTIFLLMSGILGAIALGIGKVKERLKIAAMIAVISIPLNALLIWYYGILGAVITTVLVAFVVSLFFITLIKRDLIIKIPFLFYTKILIFSIVVFLSIRIIGFSPRNLLELISAGAIYTITFILLGYALKIYDKRLYLLMLPKRR